MQKLSFKQPWYEIRDGVLIAWFLTWGIVGFAQAPRSLGGFGAGLNVGLAVQYFLFRKQRRLIEKHRRQDAVDLRTLQDIVENMSYKALHQMEKSGLN